MTDENRDKQQEEGVNRILNEGKGVNQNPQNGTANANSEQPQEENPMKNVNTGLISLEIVARMNKIDIDMRAIVREFGIETADTSPEELMRIAKSKGFKIKKKKFALTDLTDKYPMPAIIQLKDGT